MFVCRYNIQCSATRMQPVVSLGSALTGPATLSVQTYGCVTIATTAGTSGDPCPTCMLPRSYKGTRPPTPQSQSGSPMCYPEL